MMISTGDAPEARGSEGELLGLCRGREGFRRLFGDPVRQFGTTAVLVQTGLVKGELIESDRARMGATKPKMLLHVCCAPDATVGIERLGPDYDITAFFYNPNIHPEEEYRLRCREFERLCRTLDLPYRVAPYDVDRWFDLTRGLENEPERGRRCDVCLRMRLELTAKEAAENGFECFAAVLTVSPHKLAQRINEIGEEVGKRYGVRYVPTDLKKKDGFKRSVELSKQYGLYRQDYCGCVYSLRDRDRRRSRRKSTHGSERAELAEN